MISSNGFKSVSMKMHMFHVYLVCIVNGLLLPHFYNHEVFWTSFLLCGLVSRGFKIHLYEAFLIIILSVMQKTQLIFVVCLFTIYLFFEKIFNLLTFFVLTVAFCFMNFNFVFSYEFCYYLVVNLFMLFLFYKTRA